MTGTGFSLDGDDAGNYALDPTIPTTTADITGILVTPHVTVSNKVYDGTTAATGLVCTVTGVIGTDDVTCDISGATATFADANVANGITVNVTGLAITGDDADNYTITSADASTSANITAATVTGHFTAANKVYDGDASASILTRTLDDVIGLDDVSLSGGSASFSDKTVANGKTVTGTGFSLAGDDAGNYVLASTTLTTSANITLRDLTVSAVASDKVYDGDDRRLGRPRHEQGLR